jgi:hypothetical protein
VRCTARSTGLIVRALPALRLAESPPDDQPR